MTLQVVAQGYLALRAASEGSPIVARRHSLGDIPGAGDDEDGWDLSENWGFTHEHLCWVFKSKDGAHDAHVTLPEFLSILEVIALVRPHPSRDPAPN